MPRITALTSSRCTSISAIFETTQTIHISSKMGPPNNRDEIVARLRETIDNGRLIVGAGAGIGLSAKFIEQGGGDLIIIYNSGRYCRTHYLTAAPTC